MSDFKSNPNFKAMVQSIASKATVGRTDLSWNLLTEARKRKTLKQEAKNEPEQNDDLDKEPVAQAPEQEPAAPGAPADASGAKNSPPRGTGSAFASKKPAPAAPQKSQETPAPEAGEADKAKEDAAAASAELEKAKAEKDDAEKELEQQSYIHLVSQGGVSFLLGKLVDHAFKTNTIDSLATEMVQKLKIQNQEEYQLFSDEMIPFKNIPGVTDLLSSMSGMIGQQTEK